MNTQRILGISHVCSYKTTCLTLLYNVLMFVDLLLAQRRDAWRAAWRASPAQRAVDAVGVSWAWLWAAGRSAPRGRGPPLQPPPLPGWSAALPPLWPNPVRSSSWFGVFTSRKHVKTHRFMLALHTQRGAEHGALQAVVECFVRGVQMERSALCLQASR